MIIDLSLTLRKQTLNDKLTDNWTEHQRE